MCDVRGRWLPCQYCLLSLKVTKLVFIARDEKYHGFPSTYIFLILLCVRVDVLHFWNKGLEEVGLVGSV